MTRRPGSWRYMPNCPRLAAFRLETAPTLVGHLLTGYVPRIYRYPYQGPAPMIHQATARTSFYDAAVQRHLSGVDQFVVLGAGFDTRAFRLPAGGQSALLRSRHAPDPGLQAKDA